MTILKQMHRRQFLATSSVALAGVAICGSSPMFAADPGALSGLTSVAFWDARLTHTKTGGLIAAFRGQEVEQAAALPTGDPGFISTSALVSIAGYWRPESRRKQPISINVGVTYFVESGQRVKVHAWGFTDGAHGRSRGSAAQLTLPLRIDDPLEISIEKKAPFSPKASADAVPTRNESLSFRMGHAEGMKLRPGIYFIAVNEIEGQFNPDWTDVRVAVDQGEAPLNFAGDGPLRYRSSGRAVNFAYLMVAIDRSINVAPVQRMGS